jgi:hypothetical protein
MILWKAGLPPPSPALTEFVHVNHSWRAKSYGIMCSRTASIFQNTSHNFPKYITSWYQCTTDPQPPHPSHLDNGHFGPTLQSNQGNNGSINTYTLIFNSLCFFSLVDCCLAAQIANFGQNGPNMGQLTLALSISSWIWAFLPKTNPVVERDDKLDSSFTRCYISTVYKCWAAPNGHCRQWELDQSLWRWVFLGPGRMSCSYNYRIICSL